MAQVSFDVPESDKPHIKRIVARIAAIHRGYGDKFNNDARLSCRMDLCATHANGCPMDFAKLARADDFNLMHDVFGISHHINRETGRLEGFFLPRCALPQPEAA